MTRFQLSLRILLSGLIVALSGWGAGDDEYVKKSVMDVEIAKKWNAAIMEGKGRDDKAQDAQGQGNTGQAAAVAAGTALMATGIPMLASIIPTVRAQGARLVAKAALEFAQAGADSKSSGQNAGQKDLLRKGLDTGAQNGLVLKLPEYPDLDKLGAENGFNSADLLKQITSGSLTDPAAILAAVGDTHEFTPEEEAAADAAAGSALAAVMAEVAPQQAALLDFKGSNATSGSPGSSAGGSAFEELKGSGEGAIAGDSGSGRRSLASIKNGLPGSEGQEDPKGTKGAGGFSLESLFGKGAKEGDPTGQGIFGVLERFGIYRPNSVNHIFSRARQNYGRFGKWRSEVVSSSFARRVNP